MTERHCCCGGGDSNSPAIRIGLRTPAYRGSAGDTLAGATKANVERAPMSPVNHATMRPVNAPQAATRASSSQDDSPVVDKHAEDELAQERSVVLFFREYGRCELTATWSKNTQSLVNGFLKTQVKFNVPKGVQGAKDDEVYIEANEVPAGVRDIRAMPTGIVAGDPPSDSLSTLPQTGGARFGTRTRKSLTPCRDERVVCWNANAAVNKNHAVGASRDTVYFKNDNQARSVIAAALEKVITAALDDSLALVRELKLKCPKGSTGCPNPSQGSWTWLMYYVVVRSKSVKTFQASAVAVAQTGFACNVRNEDVRDKSPDDPKPEAKPGTSTPPGGGSDDGPPAGGEGAGRGVATPKPNRS